MRSSLGEHLLGLLGYAPVPAFWHDLNRFRYAVCHALAETLYPDGDGNRPSFREARVLESLHDYLAVVPPRQQRRIGLLLVAFEWSGLFTPPFRRFSRRRPAARGRHLTAWETSRWYWIRIGFSSLRMLFNLPYLAAPAVRVRIGETGRAECQGDRHSPVDLSAGVLEYPQLRGADRREDVDFAVVGSGPGGAVVARELAAAGRSVVVLEEGPFYRPETYRGTALDLLRDLFSERGLRAATGNVAIPTMQAKALGGNSVVNSAICWRAPGWLFDQWQREFGIEGLTLETLAPGYGRAERLASVVPTRADILGRKGDLFLQGCTAAGVAGRPTNRAVKDCQGCSECMFGCRRGAKQNMERCYIPDAIQHGARFYTSCRAEDLLVERGRVAGVRGYVREPGTGRRVGQVTVRAKATVLAAGVMASPLILLKNHLPWHSPAIGRNLSFHPGLAATAVFPEDVQPWIGATQGADSAAYLEERLHPEVLWVPTPMIAARLRGWGASFWTRLDDLRRTAVWCISVCGASRGRLTAGADWEPRLRFHLNEADVDLLNRGMRILMKHFLAAGAHAAQPGLYGFDADLRSEADLRRLESTRFGARQFLVVSNHVFGTCAMGADPRRAVVDSNFAVHRVPDLYVCDTSVFPSPSAVNPQLTLMAMADLCAQRLVQRY